MPASAGRSASKPTAGSLDHAGFLGLRRFPALDGLRAIAVVLIIDEHVPATAWLIDGDKGVTLFFVLSGFLITTLALREEDARGRLDLPAFYMRRTMRIFPAYYATLLLYCVVVFGLEIEYSQRERGRLLQALPWYVTYLNEFHLKSTFARGEPLPVFGQSWSLAVEEKFYLLWPLLGFLLLRARNALRLAAAAALAGVFYLLEGATFWRLESHGHILVGCGLAILMHEPRTYRWIAGLGRPGVRDAVVIGWIVFQFWPLLDAPRQTPLYTLVVAAMIAALTTGESVWHRLLSSRPARFVGARSYGMYLLHVLVANALLLGAARIGMALGLFAWIAYPVCVVVTTAVAHVSYALFEERLIARGRAWSAARLARTRGPGGRRPAARS